VKKVHEGLDFYFYNKHDAKKLVDFLMGVVACRYKTSERLISHDIQNNSYNYKHTFSVELAPVCKDDIVCLPKKVAQSMSNISQIVVCNKVANSIQFVDPMTGEMAELSSASYWSTPFTTFTSKKQLSEFTVIEVDTEHERGGRDKNKYIPADVYLMRDSTSGFGSDTQFHCRSHLGRVLHPGDTVLGFDFTTANINDDNIEKMRDDRVPEVVIIKKSYGDKKKRQRARNWKLKRLTAAEDGDGDKTDNEDEYYDFLEDLEEDSELRQNVNIYRDRMKQVTEANEGDVPVIAVEEMLDELVLNDQPMDSDNDDDDEG
jgi:nonsense-mediated mRNA decay protein 3